MRDWKPLRTEPEMVTLVGHFSKTQSPAETQRHLSSVLAHSIKRKGSVFLHCAAPAVGVDLLALEQGLLPVVPVPQSARLLGE